MRPARMSFVLPVQLFVVWITMQQLLKPLSFIRLMQNSVILIPPRKEQAQLTLKTLKVPLTTALTWKWTRRMDKEQEMILKVRCSIFNWEFWTENHIGDFQNVWGVAVCFFLSHFVTLGHDSIVESIFYCDRGQN